MGWKSATKLRAEKKARRRSEMRRRAKSGKSISDVKRSARSTFKGEEMTHRNLSDELNSILSESVQDGPFAEVFDRLDDIVERLGGFLGSDVDALEEAVDDMRSSLQESDDEEALAESVKPILRSIKLCLEAIQEMDDEDDDDDDDDDEDDDDDDEDDEGNC